SSHRALRPLHSFPTRRSSDLLQSLPGQDIDRFVLAGMISNTPLNSCYQVRPPSFDNYNPFLTEITPGWTGSNVSLSTHWWEFYRSEEHTSELQSRENLVCRLL